VKSFTGKFVGCFIIINGNEEGIKFSGKKGREAKNFNVSRLNSSKDVQVYRKLVDVNNLKRFYKVWERKLGLKIAGRLGGGNSSALESFKGRSQYPGNKIKFN
jgi:hypothetical protein